MAGLGLQGLRVLTLEARRSREIAVLVSNYGGEAISAPALREAPLKSNQGALDFAAALLRNEFDLVIFLTGAGVRALTSAVERQYGREAFFDALRRVKIAARGPKPLSVLREFGIPVKIIAPEPSTWHELMHALEAEMGPGLGGIRIAIQEYGAPSVELMAALVGQGAVVTPVPAYQWALPEDIEPLRKAVDALAQGEIDLVFFMNAAQIKHLLEVAAEMGRLDVLLRGLQRTVVCSIGPTTSEELRRSGITPDFEPSHPKMGILVNEAAAMAAHLVARKRSSPPPSVC